MILPDLTDVKSSNIAAVGHHDGALFVRFKNGGTWKYHGVKPETHAEMMRQESVGSYFHRHVKPHHKAEKVE